VVYSLIGIGAFFFSFEINGKSTFLVNHIADFIRISLNPYLPYIVIAISFIAILQIIRRDPRCFKDSVSIFLSIMKILGFIMIIMATFKFGPDFLISKSIGQTVLNKVVIAVAITISVAAVFLPFLLDFGLVDFFGVIMRPIMRPIFKCPGLSAVIAVTAYLGNFAVGHIAVDSLYKRGRLSAKESAIIGTGFCTASLPFLLVIASILDIMDYWLFYFWSSLFITFATTFITIRIWPLSAKNQDEYYPGVEPDLEPEVKINVIKSAFTVALDVARKADPLIYRLWFFIRESLQMLGSILCGAMFFATLGLLINNYTDIFYYLGFIFWPFLKILGAPDVLIIAKSAATSLFDIVLPAIIGMEGGASLEARYIIATVPVSAIVFLAAFIPCILSTEIPIKMSELLFLWLVRTIITVCLATMIAKIYF
jgi:nucleoside recognition membrane protein YjiH